MVRKYSSSDGRPETDIIVPIGQRLQDDTPIIKTTQQKGTRPKGQIADFDFQDNILIINKDV